jgi:hypothetical protein
MKWTKKAAPVEQSEREPELSAYQRAMRNRLLAAPVVPAPEPWQPVFEYAYGVPVGGLLGIGFATHPATGHDLVMVVSHDGHGLFDAVTGEKIARDRAPAPEDSTPDAVADLSCPGLGPITGSRVRIAGRRRRAAHHHHGRLDPGGRHPGLAERACPAVRRRWVAPRGSARRSVVAHLPLELLHIPRSRLLALRTDHRRGDEQ